MTSTATAPVDAPPGPIYVDTQHEDLVHDAQMDFYGSKLATCSSGESFYLSSVCMLSVYCMGLLHYLLFL